MDRECLPEGLVVGLGRWLVCDKECLTAGMTMSLSCIGTSGGDRGGGEGSIAETCDAQAAAQTGVPQ